MHKIKTACKNWLNNLNKTIKSSKITGIEKAFDVCIVFFRVLSLSYWIKGFLPSLTNSEPRKLRHWFIDGYVVLQLLVLVYLLFVQINNNKIQCFIAAYILFEMYLNLFSILFVGKLSEVNAPPSSAERSLLLFIINTAQLILSFAVFYHCAMKLGIECAIVNATLVFGTIGHPLVVDSVRSVDGIQYLSHSGYIVAIQVALDFLFLALFVSAFAGKYEVFNRKNEDIAKLENKIDALILQVEKTINR